MKTALAAQRAVMEAASMDVWKTQIARVPNPVSMDNARSLTSAPKIKTAVPTGSVKAVNAKHHAARNGAVLAHRSAIRADAPRPPARAMMDVSVTADVSIQPVKTLAVKLQIAPAHNNALMGHMLNPNNAIEMWIAWGQESVRQGRVKHHAPTWVALGNWCVWRRMDRTEGAVLKYRLVVAMNSALEIATAPMGAVMIHAWILRIVRCPAMPRRPLC